MTAFGCTAEEIDTMMRVNPGFIVGLDPVSKQTTVAAE